MGMVSRNFWSVKFISAKIYNGSRKVPSESRIRHPYVIINLLNRMGLPLSTCMHRTTPSVYLDLCQLWELDQCQERDAILGWSLTRKNFNQLLYVLSVNCTQVSNNGKHLPQFCCLHYTICQGQWWCTTLSLLARTTFQQPGNWLKLQKFEKLNQQVTLVCTVAGAFYVGCLF